MLAAVDRPGEAAAFGRHLKSEARIGDDVDPGRGSRLAGAEGDDIFPALLRKSADPVEKLESRPAAGGCGSGWKALRCRARRTDRLLDALSCSASPPPSPVSRTRATDASNADVSAGRGRRAAGRPVRPRPPPTPEAAPGGCARCLERGLQVLKVGGSAFVEDDEVHLEPASPPIFHGLQQLVNDPDVLDVRDAQQDDRQVARDALRPETGLRPGAAHDHFRGRPQRRPGIDEMSGETLEFARLFPVDAEMMELHLRLGPGERGRPLERADVVGPCRRRRAAFRATRPPMSRSRCAPPRPARGGPAGAGRRPDRGPLRSIATEGVRRSPRPESGRRAPAEEAGAVGFELRFADAFARGDRMMRRPDFRLVRRAAAARGEDRAEARDIFGLDEHFGEGRMGDVGRLAAHGDLGIGGDLDVSRPRRHCW